MNSVVIGFITLSLVFSMTFGLISLFRPSGKNSERNIKDFDNLEEYMKHQFGNRELSDMKMGVTKNNNNNEKLRDVEIDDSEMEGLIQFLNKIIIDNDESGRSGNAFIHQDFVEMLGVLSDLDRKGGVTETKKRRVLDLLEKHIGIHPDYTYNFYNKDPMRVFINKSP